MIDHADETAQTMVFVCFGVGRILVKEGGVTDDATYHCCEDRR